MSDSTDFQPGDKLPTLGVTDTNSSPLIRWALPIATGLTVALVAISMI
ncbi:MAG: hypothetical protein R3285_05600 [Kiloniellales bacterium]|nr:hypothetical protein [Kiloniellales bacterium]